jgi:hypothetical protein
MSQEYRLDTAPECHTVLHYLHDLWEATPNKLDIYDRVDLSVVAAWCKQDKKANPDGSLVLLQADLTSMVRSIPAENRWWLPAQSQCVHSPEVDADACMLCHSWYMVAMLISPTDMADANSDNNSNDTAADSADDEAYSPMTPEKKINKGDDGKTPHRVTQRASKCEIVASPIQEQPPSQCQKLVEPPVSHVYPSEPDFSLS